MLVCQFAAELQKRNFQSGCYSDFAVKKLSNNQHNIYQVQLVTHENLIVDFH